MRVYLIMVIILLADTSGYAQDSSAVYIYKDSRIDVLIKKQIAINEETTRDARRNIPGYRLQVINTNDRNAAMNAKAKIYQLFPELKAYLLYQAPYFRLRVGNFKEREEANDYRRQLAKDFPAGISIVKDIIEVKPEKPEVEN
jgi:SPOR domain